MVQISSIGGLVPVGTNGRPVQKQISKLKAKALQPMAESMRDSWELAIPIRKIVRIHQPLLPIFWHSERNEASLALNPNGYNNLIRGSDHRTTQGVFSGSC